jgi:hypothetical protein
VGCTSIFATGPSTSTLRSSTHCRGLPSTHKQAGALLCCPQFSGQLHKATISVPLSPSTHADTTCQGTSLVLPGQPGTAHAIRQTGEAIPIRYHSLGWPALPHERHNRAATQKGKGAQDPRL